LQYDTVKKKAEGIEGDIETFQVLPPAWTIPAGQFQPDPAAPLHRPVPPACGQRDRRVRLT
jgi:hypothetical protein